MSLALSLTCVLFLPCPPTSSLDARVSDSQEQAVQGNTQKAGQNTSGEVGQQSVGKRDEQQEQDEVRVLLSELESVLGEVVKAGSQVENVKAIVNILDGREVPATDGEVVGANKELRKRLVRNLRELRARAHGIATQVKTSVLPKKRGLVSKLETRQKNEEDELTKARYQKLMGEQAADITVIEEQVNLLELNIVGIGDAIGILENQLDYLDLVEESIKLGQKLGETLTDLNREIDTVIATILRREIDN